MDGELTFEILDKAIAKVKEHECKIQEIRINTEDWRKAKESLKALCDMVIVDIKIPDDMMWGIPVIALPDLPEGTMLLYYDKEHYVTVKHVGLNTD